MNFIGSKNRLSRELKPIIESYIDEDTKYYIEPFVGGANMIDKIDFDRKIGSDNHKELIELLKWMQSDPDSIPLTFTEEEYLDVKFNRENYEPKVVGLFGFCGAFGASYMTGFAKSNKANGEPRDMPSERIRNIKKQSKRLNNIKFGCCDYREYSSENIKNSVIYCDSPYNDSFGYGKNGKNDFNHEDFYIWCKDMAKNNIVLISEYNMPDGFTEIWSKDVNVNVKNTNNGRVKRVEKLFIVDR